MLLEPLRPWVSGRFDDGAPLEAAARVAGLRESVEARRELGLRVVAMTAVRLAGLDLEAIRSQIDATATLPSFLWLAAQEGRALALRASRPSRPEVLAPSGAGYTRMIASLSGKTALVIGARAGSWAWPC